jgi:hypothetical protein
MALTTDQLADMQADLGISDDETVFTDAALERLFTRAGEVYNQAVWLGWAQIMAGAVNWVDFKVAQTSMSRSQAFTHIEKMLAFWGAQPGVQPSQVAIVGLLEVPPRWKDEPNTTPRDYLSWRLR